MHDAFNLEIGEVLTKAHMSATTERNPLKHVFFVFGADGRKALRVKPSWLAPVFGHVMGMDRVDADSSPLAQQMTIEHAIL